MHQGGGVIIPMHLTRNTMEGTGRYGSLGSPNVFVVLPEDPLQPHVDLNIDITTDLAFPANSFIGAGAFGQVRV